MKKKTKKSELSTLTITRKVHKLVKTYAAKNDMNIRKAAETLITRAM